MSTGKLNLLIFVITLFVTVILAEWVLRQVLPAPIVWNYPQESYIHDDEIGHWLTAGQQAFTHDKPVSVNTFGLRGPEYSRYPEPGVLRLLALGDSQTFGNGLAQNDTWPAQLETVLAESGATGVVEVVNGGLPASDSWQHEIMLGRMLDGFNPDYVVLAFYVNDFSGRPDTVAMGAGASRGATANRLIYLLKQSALVLSARMAYQGIQQKISPDGWSMTMDAILRGEHNDAVDARWREVEESLRSMKQIADNRNTGFVVALLPRRDQVSGQFPSGDYNRRLEALLDGLGILSVNMQGPMQTAFGEHGSKLFIPWDGHNSAIANRVIAETVADKIRETALSQR